MGRNIGSTNKPNIEPELSLEERMELLARLLIDTVEDEQNGSEDATEG